MIKVRNTEKKTTIPKRNITISNVTISDGKFVDEDGDITERLLSELSDLPNPDEEFTIKISVELDED